MLLLSWGAWSAECALQVKSLEDVQLWFQDMLGVMHGEPAWRECPSRLVRRRASATSRAARVRDLFLTMCSLFSRGQRTRGIRLPDGQTASEPWPNVPGKRVEGLPLLAQSLATSTQSGAFAGMNCCGHATRLMEKVIQHFYGKVARVRHKYFIEKDEGCLDELASAHKLHKGEDHGEAPCRFGDVETFLHPSIADDFRERVADTQHSLVKSFIIKVTHY